MDGGGGGGGSRRISGATSTGRNRGSTSKPGSLDRLFLCWLLAVRCESGVAVVLDRASELRSTGKTLHTYSTPS